MKRLALAIALVVAVASGAIAQDFIYTRFQTWVDAPTIQAPPCYVLGPAQPVLYDTSLWLFYTCADGTVIPRRFLHPNDQVALTRVQPVMIVQPAAAPPTTGYDVIYDTTNKNWQNTGMTEAEWRRMYPVPR